MALSGELMKFIGNEMVKSTGNGIAKATATSALNSLIPSAANKMGVKLANKSILGSIMPEATTKIPNSNMKTLYRGLMQKYDPNYPINKLETSGYESWTDNLDLAKQYGDYVYSIDVPKSDIKTSYLDEDPKSPTYGDRNPIYSITKAAGLNGVNGTEYLLYMLDDYKDNLTYTPVSSPETASMMHIPVEQNSTPATRITPRINRPIFDEDTLNLIDTLKEVGANIDDNGVVSLYHRTTPENADNIYRTGQMYGKESDGGLFFSTNRDSQPGYGSSVVEARIPANRLILDDLMDNNADVKYVVGEANKLEDMKQYLVPRKDEVSVEALNKVRKYLEPANSIGKDLMSVSKAMREYKAKNITKMAENMVDEYSGNNFDWATIRRKGEEVLTGMLGGENLKKLKTFIEPAVNNSYRGGEHEINKTVAANFLKSKDSEEIVRASRKLLPAGTKIYRRGSKSGISWTTNKELANSGKYDGDLLEHILTKNDRYIAPEIIDILQRTIDNEDQVIFRLENKRT